MELWGRSGITSRRLEGLVHRGLLRPLSAVGEWLLPGDESELEPFKGYVVSFAIFHERGFAVPAHRFLWGLLDYYQVELQHLTPNGVQHMATFLHGQFVEEADRGKGGECADGMCQRSSAPYPVEGLPVHASGDL